MSAVELENLTQYNDLINRVSTVVILAHAQYSAQSRTLKSELNDFASQHASKSEALAFAFFDAFEADDINAERRVRSFPSYFVYKDGQLVKSVQSSNASKQQLEKDLQEFGG
jgi:thioredoxin-like negative regulator of GroEL